MNSPSAPIKFLAFKSLILAALFHVFVINNFNLSFTELKGSAKPNFIFLGSILHTKDVLISAMPGDAVHATGSLDGLMSASGNDLKRTILSNNGINKPSFGDPLPVTPKKTGKSTFTVSVPEGAEEDGQKKSAIGIDDELAPYIPLRFRKNDPY